MRLVDARLSPAEAMTACGDSGAIYTNVDHLHDSSAGEEYPLKLELRARLQKWSADLGRAPL